MTNRGSVWDAGASAHTYLIEFAPCASLELEFRRSSARAFPEDGSMSQKSESDATRRDAG